MVRPDSGHVPLMIDGLTTSLPLIKSGKIKALAVNYPTRISELPDVPTFKESGVDFVSDGWVGYVAAKGTPAPVLAKLQGAFVKALRAPAVQQKLSDMGYQVVGNTPAQFRKIVQDSSQRYGELLSTGAVKLQ